MGSPYLFAGSQKGDSPRHSIIYSPRYKNYWEMKSGESLFVRGLTKRRLPTTHDNILPTTQFIEKIEACYISSVGAGLAPALYEYISYYCCGGLGQAQPLLFLFFIFIGNVTIDRSYYAQPLLFLFFILVSLSCLFHLLIDEMFHCFKILILY